MLFTKSFLANLFLHYTFDIWVAPTNQILKAPFDQ